MHPTELPEDAEPRHDTLGLDDQRGGEAVTPGVDGNGELANAEELAELARLVREEFIHEMSILELP